MERVKAYVDGFNLYHGLKTRHGRKYLWLDLQALAVRLLKPSQHLVAVEYFTARVRNQAESEQRQAVPRRPRRPLSTGQGGPGVLPEEDS